MRFVLRWVPVLAALAWAGACDDVANDMPGETDGGQPPPPPPHDSGPGPTDASDASVPSRDCAKDVDVDGVIKHLDCTGLYADFASKTIAPDAKLYKPAVEFWSDGAVKRRFIHLPAGAKIDVTSFDEWRFPAGTKLWKEFTLDGKLVETRLYEKTPDDSWRHTVYRWNDAQTDATRLEVGETIPPSGTRTTPYEVPNTTQCNACHDGRIDPVLGFDAIGLGLPGAEGVTLASLAADGLLSATPPKTTLALPDDVGDGKAPAAIGWLHMNCGQCHNDNSGAYALLTRPRFLVHASDLGVDGGTSETVKQLPAFKSTVCMQSARFTDDAGAPMQLIAPGSPTASVVSILSGHRATGSEDPSSTQMPPLVTHAVDKVGHDKLDAWITSLTGCN